MELQRYALALDLIDDPDLIAAYKKAHRNVWPAIIESIKTAGVMNMEIYLTGNRLFMVMEVDSSFSFDKKAKMDAENPKVQEWETLMDKYQKIVPSAKKGEKWTLMEQIFQL